MEKQKVLVLGGTGAIGAHLVSLLKDSDYEVIVTSRSDRQSQGNIKYVKGNAREIEFLQTILNEHYLAIVTFMTYKSEEFDVFAPLMLDATDQFFFLSSCRSYADTNEIITENSPQLLDTCEDEEFLTSDNYALAKARQERFLRNSGRTNWTIVRPYLTYSEQRLQLGFFEQGSWLMRAIKGKTIVFSEDMASKYTTLTYGEDVAKAISQLIGNEKAFGEAFNVTCDYSLLWSKVLDIYTRELSNLLDKKVEIKMLPKAPVSDWPTEKWTYKYDRIYNRCFSNKKLLSVLRDFKFTNPEDGLRKCIRSFYAKPLDAGFSWAVQARFDQITGEWTSYKEFSSVKEYAFYLKYRVLSKKLLGILKSIKH